MRTCVFCGQARKSTKEHVWAKWLRQYPAFAQLSEQEGAAGQRFKFEEPLARLNDAGQYEQTSEQARYVAKLLPFLTVPVCTQCNSGWMSQMEESARAILDPLIDQQVVLVTPSQQVQLAAWFTKAAYAYVSTRNPSNNSFEPHEYRDLADTRTPPRRAVIWMGRSRSPYAQIALQVGSLDLFSVDTPGELLGEVRPGGMGAYLAAHSVVFIGHWVPTAFREGYDRIIPPDEGWGGLHRIWPPSPGIFWPSYDLPADQLEWQRTYFQRLIQAGSMGQMMGLTPQQVEAQFRAFKAGELPPILREEVEG